MRELRELEEKDKINDNSHRIRKFHEEINKTFAKNLDNCLDDFIDKNNLEQSEIEHWLRKYNIELKKVTL